MAQPHTILSTKILQPDIREQLEGQGVTLLEVPFIDVKPIVSYSKYKEIWPILNNTADQAIVFTSKHAVEAVDKHLHGGDAVYIPDNWEVFCLNGATKDKVAEVFSAQHIVDTAPYATELAAKIIAYGTFSEVVFFCGNQRLDTIPQLLKEGGIGVKEIVVYETTATPVVVDAARLNAVLFFSPSGVKSFFSANKLQPGTACMAIGETTAAALRSFTSNVIIVSAAPTQQAMVAGTLAFLQKTDSHK